IRADKDALAKFTNGLHAAGPVKNDFGAAIRAVCNRLGHRERSSMPAARDCASITGGLLPLGFIGPLQAADRNRIRIEELAQDSFKIPFSSRDTNKEIDAERAVLRKRMTRKVRLGEKAKAGNPSGARKLMPLRFADGP